MFVRQKWKKKPSRIYDNNQPIPKSYEYLWENEVWPTLNSFSIPGIYLYTLVGNNMTQEGHISKLETTLAEFGIQLVFSKYLQG